MKADTRAMLTELADFLEALPEDRFDYGHWVGRGWKGAPDLSCGTTACAAGWATTLPSFRMAGLRLIHDECWWRNHDTVAVIVNEDAILGSDAMAHVLGISRDDAEFLFVPESWSDEWDDEAPDRNASAKEVAAHIRYYLRLKEQS